MMAHKHAKLMMEYAKDWAETDKPWLRWEFCRLTDSWVTLCKHPRWSPVTEYRRKPRTININGFEVPEPVREPIEDGEKYFVPSISWSAPFIVFAWESDGNDERMLMSGIIHRTKEAAIMHAKALLSFTQVEGE